MSLEIVTPLPQQVPADLKISSTSVSTVLLHPDFFSLFGDWCSFLDLYFLGKSLEKTQPDLAKLFLSRLNFRTLIDKRLSSFGIPAEPFWKAIKESEALLHGSFLLSCLLDPINGTRNQLFTENSDIDILEPKGTKENAICPSCLRKLHGRLFPGKKVSMKVVEIDLFGIKKNDDLSKKRRHLFSLMRGKDIDPDFIPHIYQKDNSINSLGKFLCHLGSICKDPKFNYTEMFDSHLIWTQTFPKDQTCPNNRRKEPNGIYVDECAISVRNKNELLAWISEHVDFEFGKVAYDGEKITIFNISAVLSKFSSFPDVEKTGQKELRKYIFSKIWLKDQKNNRILQFWERSLQYQKRGFKILISSSQSKAIEEALSWRETEDRRKSFLDSL